MKKQVLLLPALALAWLSSSAQTTPTIFGGPVGIGTGNPETTLHVNGDITIPMSGRLVLGDKTGGNGEWIKNTNYGIGLFANSYERMRVTQNGVGINTTNPSAFLHVNAAWSSTGIRFENVSTGNPDVYTRALALDANGYAAAVSFANFPTTSCYTANYIPVWNATARQLGCSIMQQSNTLANCSGIGTHAGIGVNGAPMAYASSGGTCYNLSLTVNGNMFVTGAMWAASDRKFKSNIQDIPSALDIVNKLHGVSYEYKSKEFPKYNLPEGRTLGFIAQELEKVVPEAVANTNEDFKIVNYTAIIPVLTEAIKEQQKIILDNQEKMNLMRDEFNKQLQVLQAEMNEISAKERGSSPGSISLTTEKSYLLQNVPNPFSGETKIEYYTENIRQQAYIMVCDLNGKELKRLSINTSGKGYVTLNADSLQSGLYVYTLIIDGRIADSKKMSLLK